jgi:NAD(P)-dependent dehydrogenase (short-subunit alcohol dehydrogenase family)
VVVLELDPGKAGSLGPIEAIVGDATQPADAERLTQLALDRHGRIDTLCSFVGVFDHYRSLGDLPAESLDAAFAEMFSVNVKSALVLARAATPALREAGGSIILTLSSSSFYPGRGGILYVASKFALRGVVAQLAHELAPDVRVNGVAPGGTLGTDLRGLDALAQADHVLGDTDERRRQLEARTPLHRALRPEDHAGAYVYLASRGAGGLTGEILRSDGGLGVR